MPEDFTTFLSHMLAADSGGCCVLWNQQVHRVSFISESPVPGARDPNYLLADEIGTNLWADALHRLPRRGFHVDIHGKCDKDGEADCDVGVGACREIYGELAAGAVATHLHLALEGALKMGGFGSDPNPRLQGCWRSVPRFTMTQVSARLGFVPVQLELGYRLRKELARNQTLRSAVGVAIRLASEQCVVACARALKL